MDGYSADFDRFTGTKDEVLAELADRIQGGTCMGHSEDKLERLRDARAGIEAGSFSVKVGRVIYSVDNSVNTGRAADLPEPRETRDEKADKPVS